MILALNIGSSNIKFALFRKRPELQELLRGSLDEFQGFPQLKVNGPLGTRVARDQWQPAAHETLILRLLDWIQHHLSTPLRGIGHLVLHGGSRFINPVLVDKEVLEDLAELPVLAPGQLACLLPIKLLRERDPRIPQVACFDTAFHSTIALPAPRYAVPRALEYEGVRRFGFHGLSYEAVAEALSARGDGAERDRIIVAHLGQGASLCAMHGLKSVDTTMGFSALEGLVMATRPGAIDPGILLWLLRKKRFTVDQLEHFLYNECGMLGVSGIAADARTLLASEVPEAREALDLFAFHVVRHIAALAATLGGLDRLVFTGGIGENVPSLRERICRRMEWMGVTLDEKANAEGSAVVSDAESPVRVEVVPTDEERVIGRHTYELLGPRLAA